MTIPIEDVDYSQLSINEKALLAYDLMESVRAEADAAQMPPELLTELLRRVAEIEAGTAPLLSWEEIRTSVFGSSNAA